jgi:hypothetical protein
VYGVPGRSHTILKDQQSNSTCIKVISIVPSHQIMAIANRVTDMMADAYTGSIQIEGVC